ncbi:hypothetical protein RO3G_14678 [Rhizopus delemar RA 99-880]|uniref:Uncharacterized protein n=1 Tax=Rhizopus delemar (strain RA 99-880 / ATCC MYA-4621 / FGSC 9543 / NRRL 43880) TaxID=246409 RepID=I1CND7_RHIO9|nr:hypothetical protein RO3G_14678 [Rhizopus delemar RA 99-880]|eukprot:EIE89967.1 hypothetical protein RO3G_14678 [Rhizopus delemar RA 99-880]
MAEKKSCLKYIIADINNMEKYFSSVIENDCFNYTTQSLSYFLCPTISQQLQD